MIGSRTKVQTIVRRVLGPDHEHARASVDLSRVRAPIGLALGGTSPGEIAVSTLAEIIAHRHGGCGDPMSMVADLAREHEASVPRADEPDARP
jgi:xanthine dehydrogenase accessory factor